MTHQTIDTAKLEAFVGKAVGDFGAMTSSALVVIGDKLGLYRAMAGAGPLTSSEIAQRSQTTERYVRDWLINQAAGGYIEYDPATERYSLPDEHAIVLTHTEHPFYLMGPFWASLAVVKAEAKITEAFQTGGGLSWSEQDPGVFSGNEHLWAPSYRNFLASHWIPALDGVEAKLQAGANVADIGCGHGISTIVMAQAYPRSRFVGLDTHAPSIERARQAATEAGVADRVTFVVADARDFPGSDYDLISYFDCLHDMGDPAGALRSAAARLAPDGTVLVVEPVAGERTEENFNPVGRAFAGFSVLCCTPNALADCGCDTALGTIASDEAIRAVTRDGGFTRFRRVLTTPFNRIFEVRR